jgi:superfamily II DNA or RNA helicase
MKKMNLKEKKKIKGKHCNKENKYELIHGTLCLNKNGFIILNEDEMEIAHNNKKDIDEIFNDYNKNSKTERRKTFTSSFMHG